MPFHVSFSVNCQMTAVSVICELCKLAHCSHMVVNVFSYSFIGLLDIFCLFFGHSDFYFYGVKFIKLFLYDSWFSALTWPLHLLTPVHTTQSCVKSTGHTRDKTEAVGPQSPRILGMLGEATDP